MRSSCPACLAGPTYYAWKTLHCPGSSWGVSFGYWIISHGASGLVFTVTWMGLYLLSMHIQPAAGSDARGLRGGGSGDHRAQGGSRTALTVTPAQGARGRTWVWALPHKVAESQMH